jgi:imidazolonepropionase-like amidohydrolase
MKKTVKTMVLFGLALLQLEGFADYDSTYNPASHAAFVIDQANVDLGLGQGVFKGWVQVEDGRITAVGAGDAKIPDGFKQIDASGQWLTPGIIDVHSHLGDYPSPSYRAHSDGNEATSPVTAEVWAEHSVWPQDPQFPLALAGGVTTLQVLPGSANLFGGRSVVLKNVWSRTVQGMKFPGAPYGLKMACGENPKRVYGSKSRSPSTRMGNFAGYRKAWIDAQEYQKKWQAYDKALEDYEAWKSASDGTDYKARPSPPKRDLKMETLVGVLEGEILVHNHCYRADEMAQIIDLSKEFGYQVTAFHHAVEAYKIGDLLAANNTCSAMWADWWQFKLESFDGVKENVAMVEAAGACAIVHSDSATGIQRLNQEAAKAMAAGGRLGLAVDPSIALTWITKNAAQALGVLAQTGTIEVGKMADLVLWSDEPMSVYARAETVFIDGVTHFDRRTGIAPMTDFEIGQREEIF